MHSQLAGLEELVEVGKKIKGLADNNQTESPEFAEAAENYSKLTFKLTPNDFTDCYLKEHGVDNLDSANFLGVFSYPVNPPTLAEKFKEKFAVDYDKQKHLVIDLPTRNEDTMGGGYISAAFGLK